MKSVALFLLLCGFCQAQTLQRRTEPKLVIETCPQHLERVRRGMTDVSLKQSDFSGGKLSLMGGWYYSRAQKVMQTHELIPSFDTCTRSHLNAVDIELALWQFEYAVSVTKLDPVVGSK